MQQLRAALIGPVTSDLDPDVGGGIASEAWTDYEPPLGILTLASILRAAGAEPVVIDLDGFVREFQERGGRPQDAFHAAVGAIAALDVAVFGFGTICGSYPLTVRMAEQVRRLRPEVPLVFGGPQASATDVKTLEEIHCVDAVVRGEADQIVVRALEQIVRGGAIDVPGVTYRQSGGRHGGRPVRNPDAPVVLDLDAVPSPAFDLCPYMKHCSRLPVEIGRGCPFACTFCSTNDFFRRRFRMRSPACVFGEMQRLESLFGVRDFDLVHDMFTVDRKRVVEFCRFMESSGSAYTWRCSARTDFVDRELIQTMRAAGCASLFFGVETGSARLQKIIGKDLGIEEAAMAVELAHGAGLRPTVSLIVGFPEETRDDLNATASFGLNAARFDSASVQIAMLAALAGTPLYRTWRENLFFDGIIPEQSQLSRGQDDADRELIRRHPDLFSSFYGVPSGVGREYVGELRWFFKFALKRCRWLAVALGQRGHSFTDVFDLWLSWSAGRPRGPNYFKTFEFAEDLCQFVAERLTNEHMAADPVQAMASYYGAIHSILRESPGPPDMMSVDFPFRPSGVIDALRERRPLDEQSLQPATVVFRREDDRIVDSRELPALAAAVLRLCDGNTSAAQIARHLGDSCPSIPGVSAGEFVAAGLESLAREGLLQMANAGSGLRPRSRASARREARATATS